MCGRYLFFDGHNPRIKALLRQLEKTTEDWQRDALSLGEVLPSQKSPVCLLDARQQPSLTVMRWGMPRFQGSGLIINARSETAANARWSREHLQNHRCVVFACGYYEWDKTTRQKLLITLPERKMFAMAGFYAGLPQDPRFVIMTQPASRQLAGIHERMPVILYEDQAVAYLRHPLPRYSQPAMQIQPAQ